MDKAYGFAQQLQNFQPFRRGEFADIQLIKLPEEPDVGRSNVDEWEGLQPLGAAGRVHEFRCSVRPDAREIEARHGLVQALSQRVRKRAAVENRSPRDIAAQRLGPDRTGKMAIALLAGNHVPVQVLREIAEARKVDLVRIQELPEGGLGREYRIHEPFALGRLKVGHLFHVPFEDHPTKARVVRIVDQDDAAKPVLPEQVPTRRIA